MSRAHWKPLRQGELDALCGIYAIVNGLRLLCPEVHEDGARHLFRELYGAAENFASRVDFVHEGLALPDVLRLLQEARTLLAAEYGAALGLSTLRLEGPPSLIKLWGSMRRALSEQSVLLVSLSGIEDHWTVGHRVTPAVAYLADSFDMRVLPRSLCSIRRTLGRIHLAPDEVVVIRRCDPRRAT
jgi:hypothetical protein